RSGRVSGDCSQTADEEGATIVDYHADRVEIHVRAACRGLLVLSDEYYPGWKATVDGRDARIYPTDVAFRGVPVPAGTSTVVFRYSPSSFRLGLVIAVLAVILTAIVLGVGYGRQRGRSRENRNRKQASTQPGGSRRTRIFFPLAKS